MNTCVGDFFDELVSPERRRIGERGMDVRVRGEKRGEREGVKWRKLGRGGGWSGQVAGN